MEPEYLTTMETIRMLGISPNQWHLHRAYFTPKVEGKQTYFLKADVEAYIQEGKAGRSKHRLKGNTPEQEPTEEGLRLQAEMSGLDVLTERIAKNTRGIANELPCNLRANDNFVIAPQAVKEKPKPEIDPEVTAIHKILPLIHTLSVPALNRVFDYVIARAAEVRGNT